MLESVVITWFTLNPWAIWALIGALGLVTIGFLIHVFNRRRHNSRGR